MGQEQRFARRRENVKPWQLEPGDYLIAGDGTVWCKVPTGAGPARLEGWNVEHHDDGTITVSPSIDAKMPGQPELDWHGYLERSVWREC